MEKGTGQTLVNLVFVCLSYNILHGLISAIIFVFQYPYCITTLTTLSPTFIMAMLPFCRFVEISTEILSLTAFADVVMG